MKQLTPLKIALSSICALCLAGAFSANADPAALWTFEAGVPSALPNTWSNQSGVLTVQGTTPGLTFASDLTTYGTGFASALHASASSYWMNPSGNGSVRALSSDHWAVGDYYQFQFTPAAGYTWSGITLDWDQTRSASGPASWYLAFSTDGSSFTRYDATDYTLASSPAWLSATPTAINHQTRDLSLLTSLNTALNAGNTVYFRLVDDLAPTSSGGTARVDNFTIAAPVPEPGIVSLVGFGLLLCRNRSRLTRGS